MGVDNRQRPRERLVRRSVGTQSRRLAIARPSAPGLPRFLSTPYVRISLFFGVLIALGTTLLLMPWASADGTATDLVTALFTATSASFVTGLIVVETGDYWSIYGHLIILFLIEVGGLGYVAGLAIIIFGRERRASLSDRQSLRATLGGGSLGSVSQEAMEVIRISLALQFIGFLVLIVGFLVAGHGLGEASWFAVFHSVSAFHNAGFDITGGAPSLFEYRYSILVAGPITLLSFVGATGAAILIIIYRKKRWLTLPLDAKIVIAGMVGVAIAGFIGILITEWSNPATLGSQPILNRIWDALVMAVGNRTSGFSTFAVGATYEHTLFLLIWLMVIGGAAGSMTGGIKINAFMVMFTSVSSSIRGLAHASIFGREIADSQVRRAITIASFAFVWVNSMALLLSLVEGKHFVDILFDVVSGFGLVGLSTGTIPGMSDFGKGVIILSMFVGRFAPFFLALELAHRERYTRFRYPEAEVRIG